MTNNNFAISIIGKSKKVGGHKYTHNISYTEDTCFQDLEKDYFDINLLIQDTNKALSNENHHHIINCEKDISFCKNKKIKDVINIIKEQKIEFHIKTLDFIKNSRQEHNHRKTWSENKINPDTEFRINIEENNTKIFVKITLKKDNKSLLIEMNETINEKILAHILLEPHKNTITEHDKITLLMFYKNHPFRSHALKQIDLLIQENIKYHNSMRKHNNVVKEICETLQQKLSENFLTS